VSDPVENLILFCFLLGSGLLVVIFVHEFGHLLVARHYGIKVLSLSVGFGPSLLNFTDRLGTYWKLGAFPLGGNCVLEDDFPLDQPQLQRPIESNLLPSFLQRALIYAAGPISNLIFAASLSIVTWAICRTCAHSQIDPLGVLSLRLIAGFSLANALFNLLPILPLDGGRLCLAAIEAALRRRISPTCERVFFLLSATAIASATLAYFITMILGKALF
jgi:membrane-associated protease RseP (regulator of RpoE activity)